MLKELRVRAEKAVTLTREDVSALQQEDIQSLIHELQVHQIELDMQNESLRRTQIELEESKDDYRELFEGAPVGYLIIDGGGAIVRANEGSLRILGSKRERVVGSRLNAFVEADDAPALNAHLRTANRAATRTSEVRFRSMTAAPRHVRLDTIVRSSRHTEERLVVMTDVSERRRSIEALARLNRELEDRVAVRTSELVQRNIQLEEHIQARALGEEQRQALEARLRDAQRLESLGLLAAGIAHDFNNLLVGVLGNAELLMMRPGVPDDWRESLKLIQLSAGRASELTRQLLVFAGHGRMSTAPINVPDIVAETLQLLQTRLPERVELRTQIAAEVPAIQADRGQIQQLIMNLVTNAFEAIDSQGAIEIQASTRQLDDDALAEFQHRTEAKPGTFVVLRVQDTGPGMDPTTVPRIFDPFFTTKFTGRGLGLSTVLGVVQGHCGALRVQTAPGAGTSFEVAIPLAEPLLESTVLADTSEDVWRGSGTVLLIDDDDAVRAVIAELLRALGFAVVTAAGGEAGLNLFQHPESAFDLVMLDWLMPGLSGERVLKELRRLAPDLPVILISGYSTEDLATDDARIKRVQKPMTLAHLRDALREVASEAKPATPRAADHAPNQPTLGREAPGSSDQAGATSTFVDTVTRWLPPGLLPANAREDDIVYVLDRKLNVAHVNDAWSSFARDNGGEPLLEADWNPTVLESLSGSDRRRWTAIYSALLSGKLDCYEEDFHCPSPTERRAYQLRVNVWCDRAGSVTHLVHHSTRTDHRLRLARPQDGEAIAEVARAYRTSIVDRPVFPTSFRAAQHLAPLDSVGGDVLWYQNRQDGSTDILLAHVLGQGARAARLAVKIVTILDDDANDDRPVALKVSRLNRLLCGRQRDGAMNRGAPTSVSVATGLYCRLHPKQREIDVCSFGHSGPVFSVAGRVEVRSGSPLGIVDDDLTWPQTRLNFAELGPRLLLATDSALEQFDPSGEMFGAERLARAFIESEGLLLPDALQQLNASIEKFRGSALVKDDRAFLVIEVV